MSPLADLFAGDRRIALHVGCGLQGREVLPSLNFDTDWREVRLDIDPGVKPDIVGSIIDLAGVPDASVSMVFSKHNLEHVESHQVPLVLASFFRVLRPEGFAVLRTPDMAALARLILERGLEATFMTTTTDGGYEIAPIDAIFGSRVCIERGMTYMAHRTGFTGDSMRQHLLRAGFETVKINHWTGRCELGAIALKRDIGNLYHGLAGAPKTP